MTTEELYRAADGCDVGWRAIHLRVGQYMPMELRACEALHGAGGADEFSGDVDAPTGYFYRVAQWVVVVNTQGFIDLRTFDTEAEAVKDFIALDQKYSEWDNDFVEL